MHDLTSKAAYTGKMLQDAGTSLVTAESCTGGWIAKVITDVAGSSRWFDRGFVTYSNQSKQEMLGVLVATLDAYGAVSEAVVREMAQGALQRSCAGISVAVSGIAGPGGGSEDKPVGTVCLAWATGVGVHSETFLFAGDRDVIRRQAVMAALDGIQQSLYKITV